MRVAQIIDGLYIGGAEKLLVTFTEHAPDFGMNVTVVPLRIYPETPFLEPLRSSNTSVVEFRGRNMVDLRRFFRLVRYLRREKFDVVHLHLTYAIILGSLAAKLAGIPVAASVHNTQADNWVRLEGFALRHWTDAALAVGHEVAKAYQPRLGGKRMKIVLNAVNLPGAIAPQEKQSLRNGLGMQVDEILILAVGRLFQQKGYDDLISAMSILKKKNIRARLAIAGIGALRDQLATRIEELDLADTVQLLGQRSDVPQLLGACDIFVNSSLWEGLSIAILEAMAAGLPVVATTVGEASRLINELSGVLVPPREPAALADALARLCKDGDLRARLGKNAREYVKQNHDSRAWVKQLFEIYQLLVKG